MIYTTDYNNETTLNHLPHNQIYNFKVSVFDTKTEEWSEFSASSNVVDMTISKSVFKNFQINFLKIF